MKLGDFIALLLKLKGVTKEAEIVFTDSFKDKSYVETELDALNVIEDENMVEVLLKSSASVEEPSDGVSEKDAPKLYYIVNTINEHQSSISGYFLSFEAAKIALLDCSDWYRPTGTGTIYEVDFGLKGKAVPKEVYKV